LEETKGFKLTSFYEPKAVPVSLVCAIIFFGYSGVLTFLTAYSKEIYLTDAAGFFFIVFAVVVFFSRPVAGRLFDQKGENFTMYPSILIFMIGMIIFSQTHHGVTLLLAAALIGLGSGTVQSSSQAICIKGIPPHRMGLATSTFYMVLDVSIGIGPFILGLLIPFYGFRGVFLGVAIFAFASLILYYFVHGKKTVYRQVENSL
jgi:MFS family permease